MAKACTLTLITLFPLLGMTGPCGPIELGPVPPNQPPVAQAGPDQIVAAGAAVMLDASQSTDPDGDALAWSWRQTSGPAVALDTRTAVTASFTAPAVPVETWLDFTLEVHDGSAVATDAVRVLVQPMVPPDHLRVVGAWSGAPADVNVDLGWLLPSGAWFADIGRAGWGSAGSETLSFPEADVADGVHVLTFTLAGSGQPADVAYTVSFLGYTFDLATVLQAPLARKIVLDVQEHAARVLFNGWLAPDEAGAGTTTGLLPAEIHAAWRDGSAEVNADLTLIDATGRHLAVAADGWGLQGFERIAVPAGVALPDGTYQLGFQLGGVGRSAEVTYIVDILGYQARYTERLLGDLDRMIGLDVTAGQARPVFNGWLPAAAAGHGGLSGVHPVEVVAGWRNGSEPVNVDIELLDPQRRARSVWRTGWERQGFERSFIPAGVALPDGTWELVFHLGGVGRTAEVEYAARFLNWTFQTARPLLGDCRYVVQLQLAGGVATELSSDWR